MEDEGEEGVDCGGTCPLSCRGGACAQDEDCLSGICEKIRGDDICISESCENASKALHPIRLKVGPNQKIRSIYCDGEGWAFLGRSQADSTEWNYIGNFWDGESSNVISGRRPRLKESFQTDAYAGMKVNMVKLCYQDEKNQDEKKCFEFETDGANKSLAVIFKSGASFVVKGDKSVAQKYLDAMGFEVIIPNEGDPIECFVLGINPGGSNPAGSGYLAI